MSQLKKILATAAASVAMVPALGVASASAVSIDPNLTLFSSAVDVSQLIDTVAIPPGCTFRYVFGVAGTPIGVPIVQVLPIGSVSVNYTPTLVYGVSIASQTIGYIICL